MKRCSLADYERLYLRYNYAKKYLKYADSEILNNKQFQRSIQYIVNLYTHKERLSAVMLRAGHDEDDLKSIATMFGLVFNGRQTCLGEDPKNFVNMIRFVSQRMQKFCEWTVKKFSIDDSIIFRINMQDKVGEDIVSGQIGSNMLDESFSLGNASEADGLEMRLLYAIEDLKDMTDEYRNFLAGQSTESTSRRIRRQMRKAQQVIREKKLLLTREVRERHLDRKELLVEMRETLKSNIEQYKEELCRYATYKMVASDVRKAARVVCKKFGIDYKAWALEQLSTGKVDGYQVTY